MEWKVLFLFFSVSFCHRLELPDHLKPSWWEPTFTAAVSFVRYKDVGAPKVQCTVIQITSTPVRYLGPGTCLYDDWGNFLSEPTAFFVYFNWKQADVTKIYLHPLFWFSNTQNNLAVFEAEGIDPAYKYPIGFVARLYTTSEVPKDCRVLSYHPYNEGLYVRPTEVVDRDRFCFRQEFPLSMRLRYDNICARIPNLGIDPKLERHLAGSMILCAQDTLSQHENTSESRTSENNKSIVFLYAMMSFHYRCTPNAPVAVFTELTHHREFILNPAKFIEDVVNAFYARQSLPVYSKSISLFKRSLHKNGFGLEYLTFMIYLFFSYFCSPYNIHIFH